MNGAPPMRASPHDDPAWRERTRRAVLEHSDLVPPLPDLVARLLAVLARPEAELDTVQALLEQDPVLVGRMLALVNSPFYGLQRTVRSIRDAVMVLGFRGTRGLVLATSAAKLLQRDFGAYGHTRDGLWLHSAAVAAGARHIARAAGCDADTTEGAFVAGLLHDVGKLVLLPYVDAPLGADGRAERLAAERGRLGIDHAEAGAVVARKWMVPSNVQEAIRCHHGGGSVGAPLVAAVRLADALAHECGIGVLAPRPEAGVQPADVGALGLLAGWPQLRAEVLSLFAAAAS